MFGETRLWASICITYVSHYSVTSKANASSPNYHLSVVNYASLYRNQELQANINGVLLYISSPYLLSAIDPPVSNPGVNDTMY